eukprot:10992688-Alexandrium_andersonii.AAC.1
MGQERLFPLQAPCHRPYSSRGSSGAKTDTARSAIKCCLKAGRSRSYASALSAFARVCVRARVH